MIRDATTVEEALGRIAGLTVDVVARRPVSGGCIADGRRFDLSDGSSWFVKRNASLPPDMVLAEAAGLEALRAGGGPRVPRVTAVWAGAGESFIIMEWIEPGVKRRGFDAEFGAALAQLHRGRHVDRFGFEQDNYIGSTRQPNSWMGSWVDFFRERRIRYQTKLARDRKIIDAALVRDIETILARLETLLPEPEHPSLLHGDLWGGNYLVDASGSAVLIDPAAYFGNREADLAMTELFGGFSPRFYAAYREAWPVEQGYAQRASLYNLYHMLNHANIFGSGYVSSVGAIVRRYR